MLRRLVGITSRPRHPADRPKLIRLKRKSASRDASYLPTTMHSTALILLAAGAGAGAYARRVLVAPHAEAHIASAACAQSAYRGTFASSYSVYEDCSVHGVPQYSLDDDQALFHVQPAGVDQSVAGAGWSFASELESLLSSRTARKNDQVVLEGHWIQVLHATDAGALLAVRRSHIRELDAALPPYLALVALSQGPVPVSSTSAEEEHLADVLDGLEFSGAVASVLGALSVTQMHSDITWLSGEDTASPIWSRHSFTDGALVAADWLQVRLVFVRVLELAARSRLARSRPARSRPARARRRCRRVRPRAVRTHTSSCRLARASRELLCMLTHAARHASRRVARAATRRPSSTASRRTSCANTPRRTRARPRTCSARTTTRAGPGAPRARPARTTTGQARRICSPSRARSAPPRCALRALVSTPAF